MRSNYRKVRSNAKAVALLASMSAFAVQDIALQPVVAQSGGQYNSIRVLLNGRAIDFGGVPPVQQSNRVLVPLRGVFEALGASVNYDNASQTILAERGETRVQLTLGSAQAYVNGSLRVLDVPAQARLGRTLVPLRFVSEALGADVQWNDVQRTVLITAQTDLGTGNNTGGNTGGNTGNTGGNTGGNIYNPDDTNQVAGTVSSINNAAPATITIRTSPDFTASRSYTLAPSARLYRRTTGIVVRGTTPTYGTATLLGDPSARLLPGEEVRLTLNASGQVTQITSLVSLVVARIRDVQDNQIILDDAQGTTLTVGANLRVFDARGRQVTNLSSLQSGARVALFIAPSTRRIFAVSASPAGLNRSDEYQHRH
jgi:hypothetical protein